ncbi:MAG: MFS transporter [Clostridiales bacterium]|jgi:predicted MFS family arabinose efflux permease|nr:MFS transporter [Eubacteriales bacterium]MDH7565679.1 MFS transporter [Clostridiales bacterium]
MFKTAVQKIKTLDRDFLLFIAAGIFLGIGQSVDGSTLANFLKEKLHFLILQRSALEIPRELPGFLVFLIIGFLYALGDVRIAALANVLAGVGMLLFGTVPTSSYTVIIAFSFIYSCGQHVYMPVSNSIGMSFANDGRLGRKLGQINAANTAALVISSALLWCLFNFFKIDYWISFTLGAASFFFAALCIILMNPRQTVRPKTRFVFRKEYGLYYWLCILYGARKQIFLTFGPWVLVDVFKQKVTTMTILFFIISVLGIFSKPLIGYLIDKVGEKFVLGSEAAVLIFVCIAYTFAADIFERNTAIMVICLCYILDQTLSAVSMARSTYLKKIAVREEDVSPTLSLGISLDHIVSMLLPAFAGFIWYANGTTGYKYVFLGGAVIALANFISTRFMSVMSPAVAKSTETNLM